MTNKSIIIKENGIIKTGSGHISNLVINSHSSGTLKLIDGTEDGVIASGVLTSSGACVPASHGQTKLTSNATNVTDGKILTLGTTVYRFKDTPAQAYDIQIGDTASETLDNLKAGINASGTAGVEYYAGTLAHPSFVAYTKTDTTLLIVSRIVTGTTATTAINALPTTTDESTLSFPDTTYGGGTGDSNPAVTTAGATITVNGRVYTAVVELSETAGADAVVDQVLWVTSEAVFLDNFKKAINISGTSGTDYSTGTTKNTDVLATTNSNTEQTIEYKYIGTVGNSITTTTTLANYAWGGATLASGTGATGRVLHDTMTFSAVATTGERGIPLGDEEFYTGLYATVGGTLNATLTYNE